MKPYIEKELFLLSVRHACIAIYFLVIPFLIPFFYRPSLLFITLIALFITHNLAESIIWFYKSRKIRKRQSGDLSKRGHILTQLMQRLEQLIMIGFVVFFITEWTHGAADHLTLLLAIFLLMLFSLQHIQFYYVQLFFKSKSWFS
ncbi:hypothetical protein [Bacillus pumilus]|uniref:hypothetical protein n=1 Tax=Bacillus pumilus TaxID=1408 RepID=UPI0021AAFF79|nr:hypothetical protein [Bacillus pumilus]